MTHHPEPSNQGQSARRARYAAREALWDLSHLPRVRACGRAASSIAAVAGTAITPGGAVRVDPVVRIVRAEDGRASFHGVQSCGSVWACPVCAQKIQTRRQAEVTEALAEASRLGWHAAFVTLTVRHHGGDSLSSVWGAVSDAWRRTTSGSRGWKHDREEFGVTGYMRLVETTHGHNGWHVHVHALVFFAGFGAGGSSGPATAAAALGRRMADRWAGALEGTGFAPSEQHGGDSRLVVRGETLGAYFTKGLYGVKSADSAAADATASFGKAGRRGNVTPFGILRRLLNDGDEHDLHLWREWERVSKGKRQLVWSNGLRGFLGLAAEDDDETLAAAAEGSEVVAAVTGQAYSRLARRGALLEILEAAEKDGGSGVWSVLAVHGLAGYDPPDWRLAAS